MKSEPPIQKTKSGLVEFKKPTGKTARQFLMATQGALLQTSSGVVDGQYAEAVAVHWIQKLTGLTDEDMDSMEPHVFFAYQGKLFELTAEVGIAPTKKR